MFRFLLWLDLTLNYAWALTQLRLGFSFVSNFEVVRFGQAPLRFQIFFFIDRLNTFLLLDGTFHMSTRENIPTISLKNIHYLYNILKSQAVFKLAAKVTALTVDKGVAKNSLQFNA